VLANQRELMIEPFVFEHLFSARPRWGKLRSEKLANRPHWIERVQCNEACLDVIALGAFEQPVFETNWPW
jgi:hypothetical protein